MKHDNRLDYRMRLYARVELHSVGLLNNRLQQHELLLLRARIAALLEQERLQTAFPFSRHRTEVEKVELPPAVVDDEGVISGAAETNDTDDIPF